MSLDVPYIPSGWERQVETEICVEAHHGTSLDGPQYPEVWDGQLGLGVALEDTMGHSFMSHGILRRLRDEMERWERHPVVT